MSSPTMPHSAANFSAKAASWRAADRMMLAAIGLQAILAVVLGFQWGQSYLAWGASLGLLLLAGTTHALAGGTALSAHMMAVVTMAMVALNIQIAQGMLEYHFGVFVSLAFLLAYRHWAPIVTGAVVIAVHHVAFDRLQLAGAGVFCVTEPDLGRVMIHAAYVVVQTGFEVMLANTMHRRAVEQGELVGLVRQLTADDQIHLATQHHKFTQDTSMRLQDALERIQATVRQVQQAAQSIGTASAEIASGNQDLSERTEKTASSRDCVRTREQWCQQGNSPGFDCQLSEVGA